MAASAVAPDFNILSRVSLGDTLVIRCKGDNPAEEADAILRLASSSLLDVSFLTHDGLKKVVEKGWVGMLVDRQVTFCVFQKWNRGVFERVMRPHIDSLGVHLL